MTAIARAIKASTITNFIRLGGTGVPYTTPIANDVIVGELTTENSFKVAGLTVTSDKALGYVPFYAAVRNISEDVAGLPLPVYRRREDGGRERERDHAVDYLLNVAPNPYMGAMTFRETLQGHKLTWGNGYAEIEFADDGSILALWPLRPDRVTVFVDRKGDAVVYRVTLTGGGHVDLPRRKVFHVHGLGYDGLIGYSIIEKARHLFAMAIGAEKFGEDWFEKGGIPPAVLKHPATLSDRGRANLRKSIDDGTLTNRHRMALLEEGMDIETIGLPAKDAAFLEAGGMTRSLTATLMRISPDMLQDIERSTSWGTGVEQRSIDYVKFTLRAHLIRWEQEGKQRLLADEPEHYLRHVVDAILRGDSKSRWEAYRIASDLGAFSIDDILEFEDMNPLPDGLGKQHFVQLNRVPIEQMGEMTLQQRIEAFGALYRAGVVPASAADQVDLEGIDHTGAPPVTVQPMAGGARSVELASKALEDSAEREDRLAELAAKAIGSVERVAAAAAGRPVETSVHIDPGAVQVDVSSPPVTIADGAVQVSIAPPPAVKATNGHRPIRKLVERDSAGRITAVLEEEEPA